MNIKHKGTVYIDRGRLKDNILGCVCARCGYTYATIHPYEAAGGKTLCGKCAREIEIGERYIQELGEREVLNRFTVDVKKVTKMLLIGCPECLKIFDIDTSYKGVIYCPYCKLEQSYI